MWIGISVGALLVIAFIALSVMAGGPKDAVYMVRYALQHMHRGNLKVGDAAPDARVFALSGTETFHIRERSGAKPLVIGYCRCTSPPFRRHGCYIVQFFDDYK